MNTEVIMYDKYLEGKKEGKLEGKLEGRETLSKLIAILVEQNDMESIKRISKDKDYQDNLLKKYNLQ